MASIPVPRQFAPAEDLVWQSIGMGERLLAVILFLVTAPVILASALALALLSRRTPWIAHRRVGWRGNTLWMLKLRTMWGHNSPRWGRNSPRWGRNSPRGARTGWVEYIEETVVPESKLGGDARVTSSFASFCRRHSIDELPQLWHVIRGEMSLVGPRPVTEFELHRYYGADAAEVLRVKPGIAGLWQTSGRSRLTWDQRRALDLEFVRRRTLWVYVRILLRTLPEVCQGSNAF